MKNKFYTFDQFLIKESSEEIKTASKVKEYLDTVDNIDSDFESGNGYMEMIESSNSLYEFKKVFLERLSNDITKYFGYILEINDNSEFISDIYNKLPEIDETTDEFTEISGESVVEFKDGSKLNVNYVYKGQSETEETAIIFDVDSIQFFNHE